MEPNKDEATEEQATPEVVEGSEKAEDGVVEESVEGSEKDAEDGEEKGSELSHEAALGELEKTRKESARYRRQVRELERQLTSAKTEDDVRDAVEAFKAESAAAELELVKENVALKVGLPDGMAARLVGSTREELEADAKEMLGLLGKKTKQVAEPSGGLDPSQGVDDFDADAAYAAVKASRSI